MWRRRVRVSQLVAAADLLGSDPQRILAECTAHTAVAADALKSQRGILHAIELNEGCTRHTNGTQVSKCCPLLTE
jgi:hypothetical protein